MTTPSPSTWRPKAIIFDLLTALLDSWTTWNRATPTGTEAEGHKWRQRYLDLTYGAGAYTVPDTAYDTLVHRSALEAGLPAAAPEALLHRDWPTLPAWPETGSVLVRLRREGYLLGVVTNCSVQGGVVAVSRAEEAATEAAAVTTAAAATVGPTAEEVPPPPPSFKFDAAVTAEESGWYKPAKQAYHHILPKLGVAPEEVLFVAGSAGDVQGATAAGMKVVWHNRIGLAPKGDALPLREAKTLDEALKDFL